MEWELISHSPEQTEQIGEKIGRLLSGGEVIAISGELGAGKTVFTKGLSRGLGITDEVTSPTFTLVKEYHGPVPLYHIDAYRLSSSEEAELSGLGEYFDLGGVVVVEWPENIWELIGDDALEVTIHQLPEARKLSFRGGERWSKIGALIS